jgi:hypothetical protein
VIFDGMAYIGGFTMCARWIGGLLVKRYSKWAYFKTVIEQSFHLGENNVLVDLLKKDGPVRERVVTPRPSNLKEGGEAEAIHFNESSESSDSDSDEEFEGGSSKNG